MAGTVKGAEAGKGEGAEQARRALGVERSDAGNFLGCFSFASTVSSSPALQLDTNMARSWLLAAALVLLLVSASAQT